ncbi:tRNA pseudouridine(38-40) synthase TruA [Salirhabdus salicampi]|uniref:tRNA pseudouridine(38-40) synthase TruA n=1 Tax=Salirhabdus salicampi TaxID=476102 RepID=UPI0020C1F813|nr:tRNA pseudouridine(38-40) synthase TruA [Salirhabdus salicampi]MCP8618013.1 tRNA pseudouridine(38-40) synthase TruA [Salirhabdus salicampi]
MNKRLKCVLAYDGTLFSGFQIQPNNRTVQQEVEHALQKIHKGELVRVSASGRTDKGVHAVGQVLHFDSTLQIPNDRWAQALNSILPDDVFVKSVEEMDDHFHARYSVQGKEYRYKILNRSTPDIFRRNYRWHISEPLDIEAMQYACSLFVGTHDFTTFSSAKATVRGEKVRTIYECNVKKVEGEITFRVRGSGFLYNMVRIMVGTIVEVGKGIKQPTDITDMIKGQDRSLAGKTAPAQGLYLWEVTY